MAEQFCVFPDNIDPNDLSEVNRQVVIVKHITHLSVLVDELIATVKAKFPSLTLPTLDGAEGQKSSEGNGGAVTAASPATSPAPNPPITTTEPPAAPVVEVEADTQPGPNPRRDRKPSKHTGCGKRGTLNSE